MKPNLFQTLEQIRSLIDQDEAAAKILCIPLLNYCTENPNTPEAVYVYSIYSDLLLKEGKLQQAAPYLAACLALAEEQQNMELLCDINTSYGMMFFQANNYPVAYEYMSKALTYADVAGLSEAKAPILNKIALIYFSLDDYKNAYPFLLEAKEQSDIIDSKQYQGITLTHIAECLCHMNQYQEAISTLNEALPSLKEEHLTESMYDAHRVFADAYFHLEEYDKAQEHFHEALHMQELPGTPLTLHILYEHYIDFCIDQKYYDIAESTIQNYIQYGMKSLNNSYCIQACSRAISLYQILQDADKQRDYLYLYHSFSERYREEYLLENRKNIQLRMTISDLKRNNRRLKLLSEKDALTGIGNRYRMEDKCNRILKYCFAHQKPIGAFMIDIDHFKQINDTKGHIFGDQCIISVAQTLKILTSRETYHVYRFGGDEFLIIMENPGKGEIQHFANTIIDTLQAQTGLSVSAGGIFLVPNKNTDIYDIIHKADTALYEAKERRNTCRLCFLD